MSEDTLRQVIAARAETLGLTLPRETGAGSVGAIFDNRFLETQTMPTLDTFWNVASPTTLASLIADINQDDGLTPAMYELEKQAMANLIAIVGEIEAAELLEKAGAK